MLAASLLAASESTGSETGPGGNNCAPLFSTGADSTLLATRSHAAGPFFEKAVDGSIVTEGFRPVYVTSWDSTTDSGWTGVLYPLFVRREFPGGSRWNVFELAVRKRERLVVMVPLQAEISRRLTALVAAIVAALPGERR
ncbi:MAG TPA: hypothetical protein PKI32_06465, partial [Opitutales bacterium]|nr:hypothetical protein [Opitutales bacterium]